MKKYISIISIFAAALTLFAKEPVDYVNTQMGGVSHLLVPARQTIQLPHSMMRCIAGNFDAGGVSISSLPFFIHTHRFHPNLKFVAYTSDAPKEFYLVDNETYTPYSYSALLEDDNIFADFAVSKRSAIYNFKFLDSNKSPKLRINSSAVDKFLDEDGFFGLSHRLRNNTKVYIAMQFSQKPVAVQKDKNSITAVFDKNTKKLAARFGVSFISFEQAKENLAREITTFDVKPVAEKGREIWNEALGQIEFESYDENQTAVFYTSLWRTMERMVNYDEYGKFYSVYSGKVENSFEGKYFYIDDWSWDTYRTSHPLKILLDPEFEKQCLDSILYMAKTNPKHWVPKFPTIDGDNQYMNGNHIAASYLDAYNKGIKGLDLAEFLKLSLNTIHTKSLLPDTIKDSGELSKFYFKNGYIPALDKDQEETYNEVNKHMRRQCVSVTTATCYDDWCLGKIAEILGDKKSAKELLDRGQNYRELFNEKTKFFHPKNDKGQFIKDIDYSTSGGQGFRDYYTENNAYVYRFDTEHDMKGLIELMGGNKGLEQCLDEAFGRLLKVGKLRFLVAGPDHTGIVGNYSMANEPAMRIPYLYNEALAPWKTQKMMRHLINTWYRNDIMGLPGDEDGGATSAFVVFSQLGFFPTNIGYPIYDFGTPFFTKATINLKDGKKIKFVAHNVSDKNKYVDSMKIDGKPYDKSWISHSDLLKASKIEFFMSDKPNKQRAATKDLLPDFLK